MHFIAFHYYLIIKSTIFKYPFLVLNVQDDDKYLILNSKNIIEYTSLTDFFFPVYPMAF